MPNEQSENPGQSATRRWFPDDNDLQQRIDDIVKEVSIRKKAASMTPEQFTKKARTIILTPIIFDPWTSYDDALSLWDSIQDSPQRRVSHKTTIERMLPHKLLVLKYLLLLMSKKKVNSSKHLLEQVFLVSLSPFASVLLRGMVGKRSKDQIND